MNERSDTTAPAAPAMPCMVMVLAIRLKALRSRSDELDRKDSEARKQKEFSRSIYFKAAERNCWDEETTVRDMISHTEPSSLEGAAVQIAEAICRIDAISGAVSTKDGDAAEDHRAADRLLYAALRAVVSRCSPESMTVLDGVFMNAHCDPWTPVEQRIADVEARR